MSGPSTLKLIIDAAAAIGTVAVAVLAIWGDWFRSVLAPARLVIMPHTLQGDPTTNSVDGSRLMYYHLRVVNERRWLAATNCRVLLRGLSRRGPDNIFHPVNMAVPLYFVWAPAEITPPVITLVNEQILDFGYVTENGTRFVPTLYSYSNNFQGFVGPNEAVRFHIAIEATNFSSLQNQVFEVAWDGVWSHEREAMAQHLRIREIA
jgi:hypothetical protein